MQVTFQQVAQEVSSLKESFQTFESKIQLLRREGKSISPNDFKAEKKDFEQQLEKCKTIFQQLPKPPRNEDLDSHSKLGNLIVVSFPSRVEGLLKTIEQGETSTPSWKQIILFFTFIYGMIALKDYLKNFDFANIGACR